MAENFFCVHGHFYQPPREDPFTGLIPSESGAAPYRSWNERIHAQCYYPNAVLGNFARMSFNMGPTLMSWMYGYDRATHDNIVRQERAVFEKYGVGNGMAQAYNHAILPLASYEDKRTQVRWGISDFIYRFGHAPQGMWLPETAVDMETLGVLAGEGIQFTILAPWQSTLPGQDLIRHPYRVEMPEDKSIAVFFYNQDLSTRVSFDPQSTINADRFLGEYVQPKFDQTAALDPALICLASDGELYGHHQPFRDKFLAYLLDGAKPREIIRTFPGLWLKTQRVPEITTIHENTSWSCHHGIERWRGECLCTPNSAWKRPFRRAMDVLAEELNNQYFDFCEGLVPDPVNLRDGYITVVLGQRNLENLSRAHAGRSLDEKDLRRLDMLLRAQYERQRMFTSCGWFFDDYDRIEPRNNTAYAARAIWLTLQATGRDLSVEFLDELEGVVSWKTGVTAQEVFAKLMQRARRSKN